MRLVKSSYDGRELVGHETLGQMRDLGGRLEYVVARYGRLLRDVTDGVGNAADLRDSLDLMNGQLAYLARRLQEFMVAGYEERHSAAAGLGDEMSPEPIAIGSR